MSAEAARLAFERHGPNELPRGKAEGLVVLFLRQLAQPLIYVLLAAAAVTAALAHWIDAGVILGVVIANAMMRSSPQPPGQPSWDASQNSSARPSSWRRP